MMVDIKKAIEPEVIVRATATLRMFVAAHNAVRPGEYVTGDELELLDGIADELETFLAAYKQFREIGGKKGG